MLGILGATWLGNILTGKGTDRAGEGLIRAGDEQLEQVRIFNAAYLLNNFEIINMNLNVMVLIQEIINLK